MDSKGLYKMRERQAQEQLDQLAESGADVADISREIVLSRYLLQQALDAKNHLFANSLITTIEKLCRSHQAARYKAGELLERAVVLKLAERIISIIAAEFMNACADAPDRLDRASQQLATAIAEASNNGEIL
ncbi:MAG TPA: hypothetical protein VG826_05400 [Pirellulales bacterium]|nr:hypothetical protein [Pirellulales bacterium]